MARPSQEGEIPPCAKEEAPLSGTDVKGGQWHGLKILFSPDDAGLS